MHSSSHQNVQHRKALCIAVVAICLVSAVLLRHQATAHAELGVPHGEFPIPGNGRFVTLPIQIGEREVLCLVDTGVALSAFDVTLRPLLGKPRARTSLVTASHEAPVQAYGWPNARLAGQILSSPNSVACVDLEPFRQATNEPVYGVLGIDALASSRMQINFTRGRLRFLDRLPQDDRSLGIRVPLWNANDGTPQIAAAIGDERFEDDFILDTGSEGNSMSQPLFDDLVNEGQIRLKSEFAKITLVGELKGVRGRLGELAVGPFSHRDLRFSRMRANSLGLRYLSRFCVTFDFPGRCVYLQPGPDRSEPKATSGLVLKWVDGQVHVHAVQDNSPAAAAGVRPGDVVQQIDGRAATAIERSSLREHLTSLPGRKVSLTVRREEALFTLDLVLAAD